ncbi:Dot/Icm system substrate protein LidA (plasmid) [Legionella adelaidensis]|uniref:Dot/Icm system substrate protein LidA n=1 Tax=Legionella adelaidensis TaxID=45056 RepID=A0A0W0R2P9_9GAMM|nr:hypothetical protein [Legionella adelaidensis]KTC65289.1 Dot/Icm system substrate protein LidA [Legionella adelaidensis]VEH85998.1 Dot/Icm system substrate protein LidA [Legionella adelaidensis]
MPAPLSPTPEDKDKLKVDPPALSADQGLQTGEQVQQFVNSQEGQAVVADIQEKIEEEQIHEEQTAAFYVEQQRQEEAALAQAIREEEEKKEEQAAAIQAEAVAQIADRRADDLANKPPEAVQPPEPTAKDNLDAINEELKETEAKKEAVTKRYDKLDKALDETDKLENDTAAIQAKIDKLTSPEALEADQKAIDDLIAEGKDEEAIARGRENQEKYAQVGALNDMLSVAKGEKKMYGQDGQPVTSFKDAAFIVPKDQNLSKEGDKYFLTNAGGEKKELQGAQLAEMSSVRQLVSSNRNAEINDIASRISNLNERKKEAEATLAMGQPKAGTNPKPQSQPKQAPQPQVKKKEATEDKDQPFANKLLQMMIELQSFVFKKIRDSIKSDKKEVKEVQEQKEQSKAATKPQPKSPKPQAKKKEEAEDKDQPFSNQLLQMMIDLQLYVLKKLIDLFKNDKKEQKEQTEQRVKEEALAQKKEGEPLQPIASAAVTASQDQQATVTVGQTLPHVAPSDDNTAAVTAPVSQDADTASRAMSPPADGKDQSPPLDQTLDNTQPGDGQVAPVALAALDNTPTPTPTPANTVADNITVALPSTPEQSPMPMSSPPSTVGDLSTRMMLDTADYDNHLQAVNNDSVTPTEPQQKEISGLAR